MSVLHAPLTALGGALGATARAILARHIDTRFPWATFLVNALGSFLLGITIALFERIDPSLLSMDEQVIAVGFCGGFTTFSSFSHQTVQLLKGRQWHKAAINIFLNLVACLVVLWLGLLLGEGC